MPFGAKERHLIMIKDSLSNADRYAGISTRFDQAFAFLRNTDLGSLKLGRVDIADGVFANVQSYEPVPVDAKQYEMHEEYADIQVVVEGSELLVEAPASLEEHPATGDDFSVFDEPGSMPSVISLRAGDFCIVWPGEAHKPGITNGLHQGPLSKIVVKVRVAE